jgi:hypothetical protein
MSFVDPFGLLVTITTTSGTQIYVWTSRQFIDALNAQPNGTISEINFIGHGNSAVEGISDDNTVHEALWLFQDGVPRISGPSIQNTAVPLANVLKNKMAPGSTINLEGCHTGAKNSFAPGQPNISEAVSQVVPGVTVTGSSMTTYGDQTPEGHFHWPFSLNTYVTSPTTSVSVPPSFNTQKNTPTVFMP